MNETTTTRRRGALLLCLAALGAALLLAACGSSGDGDGGGGAATTAAASVQGRGDPAQLAQCLEEQGVELPAGAARGFGGRPPEGGPPEGGPPEGGPPVGGPPEGEPPEGGPPEGGPPQGRASEGGAPSGGFRGGRDLSQADRERLQAALEACGAERFGGGPGRPGAGADSAARRRAIGAYAACVRRNGYDLPEPNLSGDGPVFDDGAVDRDDPAFVRASRACEQLLR